MHGMDLDRLNEQDILVQLFDHHVTVLGTE